MMSLHDTYSDLYWSNFNEIHIKIISMNSAGHFQWVICQDMEVKKSCFLGLRRGVFFISFSLCVHYVSEEVPIPIHGDVSM